MSHFDPEDPDNWNEGQVSENLGAGGVGYTHYGGEGQAALTILQQARYEAEQDGEDGVPW